MTDESGNFQFDSDELALITRSLLKQSLLDLRAAETAYNAGDESDGDRWHDAYRFGTDLHDKVRAEIERRGGAR